MVNDDEDRSLAGGRWQMGDEVKGYGVPYLARNRERLQQSFGCGVDQLVEYAAKAEVGSLYPRMSSYSGGVIIG